MFPRHPVSMALLGLATVLVGACATTPMGPTIPVMPAPNEPFQTFAADQAACKQYASDQVRGQADAANQRAAGGAVLSTVIGAALGAAVGGHEGAGVGAASGAVFGTAGGANSSQYAQGPIQMQYDNAFAQCMYAKGAQVPGYRSEPAPPAQTYGQPYGQPNGQPYGQPSEQPYGQPNGQPYGQPSEQPYEQPNGQPYAQPYSHPNGQP